MGEAQQPYEAEEGASRPAVRALLAGMRANAAGPFLFPGKTPDTHQVEIKRFWASVCRKAGLNDIRVHDLRHSHASILASSGMPLPIIGQLLGHTLPATTARYAHLFDDPLRQATERVGALFEAVSDGNSGEIVRLNKSSLVRGRTIQ